MENNTQNKSEATKSSASSDLISSPSLNNSTREFCKVEFNKLTSPEKATSIMKKCMKLMKNCDYSKIKDKLTPSLINTPDLDGNTLAHHIVDYFVNNQQDKKFETYRKMFYLILSSGIDVEHKNNSGQTIFDRFKNVPFIETDTNISINATNTLTSDRLQYLENICEVAQYFGATDKNTFVLDKEKCRTNYVYTKRLD